MKMTESRQVYYADCDQFDNSRTGYYATPAEAEAAFWAENVFTDHERRRVRVYTVDEATSSDVLATARELATRGISSPGIPPEALTQQHDAEATP